MGGASAFILMIRKTTRPRRVACIVLGLIARLLICFALWAAFQNGGAQRHISIAWIYQGTRSR